MTAYRRTVFRARQFFKLGNKICRSTGILPVFFGHGQDARATSVGKLIGPGTLLTKMYIKAIIYIMTYSSIGGNR